MTMNDGRSPTADEIERAKTPNGGWTKDQLAEWGVSWPPPKGWRKNLIRKDNKAPVNPGAYHGGV
jgi:hypothetical protein